MTQDNSNAIVPAEWSVMQQQASALVASGFLPQSVNSPQKAVAIIMLGRELGIAPWAALTSINVIQGKPTVSPQLMLALINRSGQLEDMTIDDDGTACTVTMKRKGRTPHTFTFSMMDANAMNLSGKDNWKKQPAIMRQWRAVAGCARTVFADVILGLYTPDEMGIDVAADDQGNMTVIDVRPEPLHQPQNGHEPEAVRVEQPSAKVVGVQPTRPTPPPVSPQASPVQNAVSVEPDPLAEFGMEAGATVTPMSDEDPRVHHCDILIVNRSKGVKQYALAIVNSRKRIAPVNPELLKDLHVGDALVKDLDPGNHDLIPSWSVYAEFTDAWHIDRIVTGMGDGNV